jgi:hypothetical protein
LSSEKAVSEHGELDIGEGLEGFMMFEKYIALWRFRTERGHEYLPLVVESAPDGRGCVSTSYGPVHVVELVGSE